MSLQQSISNAANEAQSFISASKVKDVIIGVLVAYVALDLLLHCITAGSRPGLFQALGMYSDTGNVILVLILAIAFGVGAWYLASRKTPKKDQ